MKKNIGLKKTSRKKQREYYYPKLDKVQANRVLNVIANLNNYFTGTCNILHLPAATRNRIEHHFNSEVGLKIYHIAKIYKGQSSWKTYLRRCLVNIAILAIRGTGSKNKEKHVSQLAEEATLEELFGIQAPEVEDAIMRQERIEAISEGINKLPKYLRETIKPAYYKNKNYKEIAKTLKIPVGTVKRRMFDARAMLREILKKDPRIFA